MKVVLLGATAAVFFSIARPGETGEIVGTLLDSRLLSFA